MVVRAWRTGDSTTPIVPVEFTGTLKSRVGFDCGSGFQPDRTDWKSVLRSSREDIFVTEHALPPDHEDCRDAVTCNPVALGDLPFVVEAVVYDRPGNRLAGHDPPRIPGRGVTVRSEQGERFFSQAAAQKQAMRGTGGLPARTHSADSWNNVLAGFLKQARKLSSSRENLSLFDQFDPCAPPDCNTCAAATACLNSGKLRSGSKSVSVATMSRPNPPRRADDRRWSACKASSLFCFEVSE